MATNELLPFGTGVGANVLDQSSYSALSGRTAGFTAGTAVSAQFNKVWRQSAFTSSMIGQFTADYSGNNVLDDGNIATYEANFLLALKASLTGYFPVITTTNQTIYVRTDGNDANDGSANTSAKAFATIQAAITYAVQKFVLGGKTLTIQLGNSGTYAAPTAIPPAVGAITIKGDPVNISSYAISGAGTGADTGVLQVTGMSLALNGLTISNAGTNAHTVFASQGGSISLTNVSMSAAAGNSRSHIYAAGGGSVTIGAGLTIGSSMGSAFYVAGGSISFSGSITVTFASAPTFSSATVISQSCGSIQCSAAGLTFTATGGAVSGVRYSVLLNGVINTNGGGANFIPGSSPGTTSTGGQYA